MKASLVAFITLLPLLTIGSPTPEPKGIRIPLTKRSKLVDEDGIVSPRAAQRELTRLTAKLQRGFAAFEKNTGAAHPLAFSMDLTKRATGTVPLTDEEGGALWQGAISVGTPASTFTVDFDTGSSDLFLPGPNCQTNCQGHKIYNPGSSSTSRDQGNTFSLAFGDGSTVQGEIFRDTVTVGGLTATNQAVGAATQYSTGFALDEFPPDGLMGMAFPAISEFGANPVFQTLIAEGVVSSPVFGFRLAPSGSELTLGFIPSVGTFTQLPVGNSGFWQVNLDSVNVNGAAAVSRLPSIVDTGTTLVVGDQNSVTRFYAAIPGAQDASSEIGEGFFTFPCSSVPNVSMTFGGRAFSITNTFNLGRLSAGSTQCVGGVVYIPGINFWIAGDIFLQNVFASFDVGNLRVGFAAN
ncbi:hypothetical protein AMATHDRAFT_139688 [Amanita thiersii Skay4041]|uniref:Peptidase A1 domain-containing protein n=1 Tax=Amanita thiersii Skay4041 TaxID=703135 RepID=A0A2A9NQ48_9AGAR|nr:hypothetical protein AMATHDRAFT_139688 [Amanita thiersii Skay4041]